MSDFHWTEAGQTRSARWRSESGFAPPERGIGAGNALTADTAIRLARQGQGLLWGGDFQNARKLLDAMTRRLDRVLQDDPPRSLPEAFHEHRRRQAEIARTLGMLLLLFDADHRLVLGRAPDVRQACLEVYGVAAEPYVASLRELQGLIGAHEWRKKGILVPALGERIHPHYGVFAPIRGDYTRLVAQAPLPSLDLAFDIGTGTGVLAAILGRRGVQRIVASDLDPRAVACARENLERLGMGARVATRVTDLFPEGRAPLVVCNPPWIPAEPTSPLEHAVYDPDSRMLRAFLAGLAAHLEPRGEGWLILSDFAEHLGLRSRTELLAAVSLAGLRTLGKIEVRPTHPRATDAREMFHAARTAEVVSLWRLGVS
ncbi:MAG TPA: class I SAM-dependent methyltransferase [Planctomycetota bacterium]|nr:class I SAM-dependent methyltransferase [Planctomycetota bacterium]